MNCHHCGADNREDRKFCRECGSPLAPTCPSCGTENEAGDKFCGACGHTLVAAEAAAAESSAGPLVTGKRFVSVLFADLVGFTSYSERRDSEDVRDLLTGYFDRAREIIERFGGTVDKFIGDAVMGVWGATGAREDDAERAVRAALELVDMAAALGHELGLPELALRAGVNSGTTTVGPGGNEKGLVVGDLVNVASRLQSLAEPGTVTVGSSTHSVTSHSIHYEPLGTRELKGKEEPVPVFKAMRVVGLVGGRPESELRHPPFVGREREMRLLKDLFQAVESEQRARLISVVGEGGIGKTRLAEEFKNHLDGFTADVYWHQGRSPSYGDGVAFWALGEMVRRRAGIVEGEDPARARTRLRTCLAEFVSNPDDVRWIEPRLEGLLGLGEMPPGGKPELFSALRSFFQHIAVQGTTVLVFEDLHWADAGLIDFIAELVERSTRSPLLVITLARPDLLDRFPTWGGQHRSSMSLRLSPLSNQHMHMLLTEHLPGVEPDLVGRIVERSAGFPLYAVEMVRMLTGTGHLIEEDGRYRYDGTEADLTLPDTLHAMIGARLDRLDATQRSLLQDGAVLGQTFTTAAISALREEDPSEYELRLRALIQLEILDIEDDPRSPERGQYRFVQSLIREVAYERLSRQDRRDKHLAAAAHFESRDDPELAGVVAGHVMGAYNSSPEGPDREALAARALAGLTDAAQRAGTLGSHRQAEDLFNQAIALSTDPDQRAEFQLRAARMAEAQSEVARSIDYVEAADAHYAATGNLQGRRKAATTHSWILNGNYRSDEALPVIKPVYDDLEDVDDEVSIGVAAEAARSLALNFDLEAVTAVDRLLPGAAALGLNEIILESLVTQATSLAVARRLIEAKAVLLGAAQVAEELGFLATAGRAYNNLGAILYIDSPREAVKHSSRVGDLARRLGDHGWTIRATRDSSSSATRDGRFDEALAALDEFEADQLSDFWKASFEADRAFVSLFRGDDPDAVDRALAAIASFDSVADPQLRAGMDQYRCHVLQFAGRWDEAFDLAMGIDRSTTGAGLYEGAQIAAWTERRDWVEQVQAAEEEVEYRGRLADGTRLLIHAVGAGLDGDRARAAELFDELIDLFEPIVLGYDLAMVRAVYAKTVGQDHPAAARAARDAQAWISETGSLGVERMWAEGLPAAARTEAAG